MGARIARVGLLLWLLVPLSAHSESDRVKLSLQQVDRIGFDDAVAGAGGERVVDLYLRVLTKFGTPIRNLAAQDLEVWQDDERIDSEDLTVRTLETTGRGVTAVLAIDASGTMRGKPFEKAKEAAISFLGQLRSEDRVAILTLSEDITVVAGFGEQRSQTREIMRTLEIDIERSRHTLLYDGAFHALDLIRNSPAVPRRSFVILFSDGKDDGSDRNREDVLRQAKGRNHESQIVIFSVGYARFDGAGLEEMRIMAEETGGEYMEAKSPEDVSDFFDLVARQMTQSYLVSYPSSMDGEQHKIRVTVAGHSQEHTAYFPEISGPIWPWLVALLLLAVIVLAVLVARRSGSAGRLSIVSGSQAGNQYALKKGKTRIGALEDNDLVLTDANVSRYHAEIVVRGGSVEVIDLESTNGTMINDKRVRRGPVNIGDTISIADVEILYQK